MLEHVLILCVYEYLQQVIYIYRKLHFSKVFEVKFVAILKSVT